jgi:hypothetical protein
MHRAAIGNLEQPFPLLVGQVSGQRDLPLEPVDAALRADSGRAIRPERAWPSSL